MRCFELLTAAASIGYLLWLFFGSGLPSGLFRLLPFAAALLLMCHLLLEGGRWEMSPLYALVAGELVTYLWCSRASFRIGLKATAIACSCALALVISSAVAGGVLWPVPAFASPTGPHPVGSLTLSFVEPQPDPYVHSEAAKRELVVEVWYPAAYTAGFPRMQYRDGESTDFREASIAMAKTWAYRNAPVAQGKFPLLLFGGPKNRFQNTFETEELASHGFIVAAVDYPYDSEWMKLPDGRLIRASKEAGLVDFTSDVTLAESLKMVERRLAIRVADTRFVLDRLLSLNRFGPGAQLWGRFDPDRIGIFGHSFGGAVAAELCRSDARVRAGMDMDGSVFGGVKDEGAGKPFFFMYDTPPPTGGELNAQDPVNRRMARALTVDYKAMQQSLDRAPDFLLQTHEMAHMNYSDYPLFSQWKPWTGAGTVGIRRTHQFINQLTLAFFEQELLGRSDASLESIVRTYPGAVLRTHL